MTGTRDGDRRLAAVVRREPGGSPVLVLSGDLDQDSADVLRRAVADYLADGAPRVLLDLADVEFCDSTGLNVLLRARQSAESDGRRLELCALGNQVARLFEVTGADGVFTIHTTVSEALGTGG